MQVDELKVGDIIEVGNGDGDVRPEALGLIGILVEKEPAHRFNVIVSQNGWRYPDFVIPRPTDAEFTVIGHADA